MVLQLGQTSRDAVAVTGMALLDLERISAAIVAVVEVGASEELNNNAIDRRNICNVGRRNYRSSMREDYSAVPKTVVPRLRRNSNSPWRQQNGQDGGKRRARQLYSVQPI